MYYKVVNCNLTSAVIGNKYRVRYKIGEWTVPVLK